MGESARAAVCFSYFFLAMASYYILKPVRESVFLHTQGYEKLPFVHLIVSVTTLLAAQAYSILAARFPGRWLIARVNLVFAACIFVFWAALGPFGAGGGDTAWLPWIYYAWVAIFGVFVPTLFWSFAHDLFRPEEGSRLYGLIGAGGILGAALGGWLTKGLAVSLGSANLLLVSASLMLMCVAIGFVFERMAVAPRRDGVSLTKETAGDLAPSLSIDWSYVCLIGLIVVVYQALSTLVDYQTKFIVKGAFSSADERTVFFGHVYIWVNLLALGINLGVTGPVQSRWGPLPGLLTLPCMALVAGVLYRTDPDIGAAELVTILGLAVTYSIFQASKEILYLPTPPKVRFAAKGFIDTFLFRAGDAVAAIWILLTPPIRSPGSLSPVVMALGVALGVTVSLVSRLHRGLVSSRQSPLT